MSNTVEDRVVKFQFDNSHFEKNVSTSMSTLDKLKEKLGFKGATKGLEDVQSAAKNVDMSGLCSSVESVGAKFSALDVIAVTALANVTNSAVNAGKRILSAFTVEPITTGFNEYELKMGSVQTIMASTGASLEEVNSYLAELNTYSDKTIYSFADMTNNIGKFTNAGVSLDKAVLAIKGVSNEAAVSGANANEASRAMYNFAQALSAGYVKLIDWKSIENANMATVEFKQQLIDTAVEVGTLTKNTDGTYQTSKRAITATQDFNDSLQDQWMTTDVLVNTLSKYADETTDIGKKAYASAQDVKTFSMMMDTLKEAAQSGWATTWELIIGDFEQAKALFTGLSNFFGGIIGAIDNVRNTFLEDNLGSRWNKLSKYFEENGLKAKTFQKELNEVMKDQGLSLDELIEKYGSLDKAIQSGDVTSGMIKKTLKSLSEEQQGVVKSTEKVNNKLEEFQKVVNDVWYGTYYNGEERVKALTDAGYDYAQVQDLVNKTVDGHKLTLEDLVDTQGEVKEETMKAVGFTEKEIEAFKKLSDEAQKSGSSLDKFIKTLTMPSGRELAIETVKNAMQPLITICKSVKKAWDAAFPPSLSTPLYDFINALHSLSEKLVISKDNAKKLTTIFTGLFNGISIVVDVFKALIGILTGKAKEGFDDLTGSVDLSAGSILDFVAGIAKAVTATREWMNENDRIFKVASGIANAIYAVVKWIAGLVKYVWEASGAQAKFNEVLENAKGIYAGMTKPLSDLANKLKEFFKGLSDVDVWDYGAIAGKIKEFVKIFEDWAKKLPKTMENVPDNVVRGFVNGLQNGIGSVKNVVETMGLELLRSICNVLGIHSPSVEAEKIGGFFMEGLYNGLSNGVSKVVDFVKNLASSLLDGLGNVDFTKLFVMGSIGGFLVILNRLTKPLSAVDDLLKQCTNTIRSLGVSLKGLIDSGSEYLKAKTLETKAEALYTIAKAIALVAGSLALLTFVDQDKLGTASLALAGVAIGLGIFMNSMAKVDVAAFGKVSVLLLSMGVSILIVARAMQKLAEIPAKKVGQVEEMLITIGVIMGVITFIAKMGKGGVGSAGTMLLKMAVAIGILAYVIKMLVGLSDDEDAVWNAVGVIAALMGFFVIFVVLVNLADEGVDNAGNMLLKMAVAIVILAYVIKMLVGLSDDENSVWNAVGVIGALMGFFVIFIALVNLVGDKADNAGNMLIKMSIAIGILGLTLKLIGTMPIGQIIQGGIVIAGAMAMFLKFEEMAEFAGNNASKAGSMLLKMAFAIGILALTIKIIATISVGDLVKGGIVIGAAMYMFKLFVESLQNISKNADKAGNVLLKMSASILILAIAIALLSILDPADVVIGTACVSALMYMFSLVLKQARVAGKAVDSLKMMAICLAILVGSVVLLTLLPDESRVYKSVGCIAVLMLCFTAMEAASQFAPKLKNATKNMLIMAGIVAILALIVAGLAMLPMESSIAAAASLSILLLTMSASLAIMSVCGTVASESLLAMAIMTIVVAALAGILKLLSEINPLAALSNTIALSTLLISMSLCCAILAGVGLLGPAAYIGVGALLVLVVAVGALMVGIGALAKHYPKMEEFLDKGLVLLEKIGYGIGSFFGNMVGGFIGGMGDGLIDLADDLSNFMEKIQPFLDGASSIDPGAADNIKALATAIMYITGADLIQSIGKFLTGGNSLSEFGEQLEPFGTAMQKYSDAISGIDPEAVTASATAAEALAKLNDSLPKIGGVMQWFGGEATGLDSFGEQLEPFGTAMQKYSDAIVNVDPEAVTASATAAQALGELYSSLPAIGGVIQQFAGETMDLETFGTQITSFGEAIALYSASVDGLDPDVVTNSVTAAQALVQLQNDLPAMNGVVQWFTGQTTIDTFGKQICKFGDAIVLFSSKVSKKINKDAVTAASNAGSIMAELAEKMPKDTTWWDTLCGNGKITLEEFGEQLAGFGTQMSTFSNNLGESFNPKKVTKAVESTSQLTSVLKNIEGFSGDGVSNFVDSLNKLGETSIDGFVKAFENAGSKVKTSVGSMMSGLNSAITENSGGISSSFESIFTSIQASIMANQVLFQIRGLTLMTKFKTGITQGIPSITSSLRTMMSNCVNSIKGYSTDFYSVGVDVVKGFANGISENTWMAEAKARAMAEKAKQAAKAALDSNSPSKVFIQIGKDVCNGFAIGIDNMTKRSTNSARNMASSVIDVTSSAMDKVARIANDGLDICPTIRPVIDMNSLNSTNLQLGSIDASIGGHIESLSDIMSSTQSAIEYSNKKVIDAINDLRTDINTIAESEGEIGLYIDGKRLAATTAKHMDRQLSILAKRRAY